MEHAAADYQSNYSTIRFFKIVPITLRTSFIIGLMKLATELEVSLREFISAGAAEVCERGGRLTPLSKLSWEVPRKDCRRAALRRTIAHLRQNRRRFGRGLTQRRSQWQRPYAEICGQTNVRRNRQSCPANAGVEREMNCGARSIFLDVSGRGELVMIFCRASNNQ